jgi:hypothetical protein
MNNDKVPVIIADYGGGQTYGSAGFSFNFFACVICGVVNLRQKGFGFSIRIPGVPRAFIIWLAHAVNVVRPAAPSPPH